MSRTPAEVMQEEPHIVLHLPQPPTTNHLRRPVRTKKGGLRLANTSAYETWKSGAGLMANVGAHGDSVPHEYALRVAVPSVRDIDNYIKPIGDLLQSCGIVKNDRHCVRIVVDRDAAVLAYTVRIELWSVS